MALRDHPELADRLRVIASLGPSTIQPFVAARRLPKSVKMELRAVLLQLGADPLAREVLGRGLIERFVPVTDASYDDIRAMWAVAEAVEKQQPHGRTPVGLPVLS